MLKITFKYAGNGDCIAIDYIKNGNKFVGLIDCNKVDGSNPAINYLENEEVNHIEFIFLSHPHKDHYSGFSELLDYCKDKKISINYFCYTAAITKEYLKTVVLSRDELETLGKLYLKIARYTDEGLIHKRGLINDINKFKLSNDIEIEILSPSETESDEFKKSIFKKDLAFKVRPNSNIVSLVTKINFNNKYILLTSDVEKPTLKRLGFGPLKNHKPSLKLGQVPHHGSIKNHYRAFWRSRNYEPNTPLAISTGPDLRHKHPSIKVINELEKYGYEVNTTGNISRLRDNDNQEIDPDYEERLLSLNLFSKKSISKTNKDLVYNFNIP